MFWRRRRRDMSQGDTGDVTKTHEDGTIIRSVTPEDVPRILELIRDAFWDVYRPGCVEHAVYAGLRPSPAYVAGLDLVAERDGVIVGHAIATLIGFSPRQQGNPPQRLFQEAGILVAGPLAVVAEQRRQGIGSRLMTALLSRARDRNDTAVVLYGDPAYYRRFGFDDAYALGLSTSSGANFPQFMALELRPNALAGAVGSCHEVPAFAVTAEEVDAFDAAFAPREKHRLPGQLFS